MTTPPCSSRRRRRITTRTTRKPSSRRTLFKKKQHDKSNNLQTSSKIQEPSVVSPATSPTKPSTDVENADNISACSTPKGRRFRIPEIKTCPPAPKKRRVFTGAAGCNSLRRTPVAFFAHPDIELFFYLALRGIPV